MPIYNSLSAIITDPSPPFPSQLLSILIHHLSQAFQGSIEQADNYWQQMNVKLYAFSSDNPCNLFNPPEYSQHLYEDYYLTLYLTGDAGQGCYLLTQHAKELS